MTLTSLWLAQVPVTAGRRVLASLGTIVIAAAPAAAQQAASCSGPGAAFGVTAYQCASCTIRQSANTRTQYVFQAEPVVLETSKASVLQPGDVIEAVDGEPILTRAGADRFTYPSPGSATVTVRRGGIRMRVATSTRGCDQPEPAATTGNEPLFVVDGVSAAELSQLKSADIESIEVLKGPLAKLTYGDRAEHGVVVVTTKHPGTTTPKPGYYAVRPDDPIIVIDGVVQPKGESEPNGNFFWGIGRYGFAIGCVPSCTRTKASDGSEYYKFDGDPPIVAVLSGGVAERMGLRVGDVVTQIDGKSILEEDGALRFFRGNKTETMRVTVTRDRQQIGFLLKAR